MRASYPIEVDCDSDGNDPPEANFVDPRGIEDQPPPRGNQPVTLPFLKPQPRRRFREEFESKVGFEEWVDSTGAVSRHKDSQISRLVTDSDLPVGRDYFYKTDKCPNCGHLYDGHIPGQWNCVKCKTKVWQLPTDPESRNCAICRREVSKIIVAAGHKIRNPLSLNAHHCKRCGRIVCDGCYEQTAIDVSDLGYTTKQRVCKRCLTDVSTLTVPPQDEDPGTLHEEEFTDKSFSSRLFQRWVVPHCPRCNIFFEDPPPEWLCTSCRKPVWQQPDDPDSATCWLCDNRYPKVTCHDCGHLVCYLCGAYAQPVPQRGFHNLKALSVCKACYRGTSITKKNMWPFQVAMYRAVCSQCKVALDNPPNMWLSQCHKAKAWQMNCVKCPVCTVPLDETAGENCRRCGKLVCGMCSQFKEPVVDRGYSKETAQTICRDCFQPGSASLVLLPCDTVTWPPFCPKCRSRYTTPPERWQCPNECGSVWQHSDHAASRSCWCCGTKLSSSTSVNCRRCGRLVCSKCSAGRSELTDLGFPSGVQYPTCTTCLNTPDR